MNYNALQLEGIYTSLSCLCGYSLLFFVCLIVCRPPPEYTWLKDGNNIQQNDRITFTQNSRILKVTNANALDTGAYSCRLYQSTTSITLFSESASIVVNGMYNL